MNLAEWRREVDRRLAKLDSARERTQRERDALRDVEAKLDTLHQAQELAQAVAARCQANAHEQIAGIVTRCLEAVFPDPYQFRIHFERKRGRTEARLVFERDGVEVDPMTACGGGVVDVASFALRLVAVVMSKPPLRRLLILDEPFRFVSRGLRDRVRLLLETLAADLGVQIVMVTHDAQLEAGSVVHI